MKLRDDFRNPSKDFRGAPFWSWNDDLKDRELCRQVRGMKAAGLGGFFMHSRIGLITPYLSEEWMDRIRAVIGESRRLGMNAWLYDEDRWPSGFAGGMMPSKGPEYGLKRFECEERGSADVEGMKLDEDVIGIFTCVREGGKIMNVEKAVGGEAIDGGEGKAVLIFRKKLEGRSDWYNGYGYVDLMSPKVVDAFIDSTYEAYKGEFRGEFGRTIPGIFTDEPNFSQWGETASVPWTERLSAFFKERNGYDILDALPGLFYDFGEYMRVRVDFWSAVTDLFMESFSRRIYDWCKANRLKFTGHYLCEDNLTVQTRYIGAAMPHYEYMHVPGIDHLGRNIDDLITVKQVSSAAHQLGKGRVLCETYGCSGWNMSFEDQKWIGDWQLCLGVNLLNQHLALYSLRGCRKRDFPPSINYQQPWWPHYRLVSDYFARLSYILTRGRHVADILVIHPIQSAWSVYSPRDTTGADALNKRFVYVSEALCGIHRDYDFGDEKIMAKLGRVDGDMIIVGESKYKLIIVPPCTTLRAGTFDLLRQFVEGGGKLIFIDPVPELVDCRRSDRLKGLMERAERIGCDKDWLRRSLDELLPCDVDVKGDEGKQIGSIYYQHRILGKVHIYFFANTDRSRSHEATICLRGEGRVEEWDPLKGSIKAVACRSENGHTILKRVFQRTGSLLLMLDTSKKATKESEPEERMVSTTDLRDTWEISKMDYNALTLDYCQYKFEGREWSERVPVWKVQREAEKSNEKIKVSLRYTFRAEFSKRRRRRIYVVMETPEKYEIMMNGKKMKYKEAGWWVDISFKRVDISRFVVNGENALEVTCLFRRPTIPGTLVFLKDGVELESVYVIGDFAVKGSREGFYITDESEEAHTGDLVQQGYPFYTGTMVYTQTVKVKKTDRTYIEFESLDTIVTRIVVNGKVASIMPWKPHKLDISRLIREGRNKITVEAVSSCRNLLGPHHHMAGELTWVGPGSFSDEANWTDEYSFVKFGIGKARLVHTEIQRQ